MDEKIMNLATAEEIDINNIELISDDELQEGLRKAFGALSTEEEPHLLYIFIVRAAPK